MRCLRLYSGFVSLSLGPRQIVKEKPKGRAVQVLDRREAVGNQGSGHEHTRISKLDGHTFH